MKAKWLGPGIVIAGAAVAGVAIFYWRTVQPVAGEMIDSVPCGDDLTMVVRAEASGERSFIELHTHTKLLWDALIPHYAGSRGRPALTCGTNAATVRIERSGRAEVFGFLLQNGEKIGGFRLATEHEPITTQPTGPITIGDGVRSYEFVGGSDWHQVIAVDLDSGEGVWKADLGPQPVTDAGFEHGKLRIRQGDQTRFLDVMTGHSTI